MTATFKADIAEHSRIEIEINTGDDALHHVRVLHDAENCIDDWLIEAITAAREGGASWDDVGRALGVSRQAAWEAFRDRLRPALEHSRQSSGLTDEEALALAVEETRAVRRRRRWE